MSEKSKIEKNSEENAAIMKLLDEMYRKSSSQPTPAEKKDNKKAEKKAESPTRIWNCSGEFYIKAKSKRIK